MQSDRYVYDPQGARIFNNLTAAHRMVAYLKEQEELTDAAVYRGSFWLLHSSDRSAERATLAPLDRRLS